VQIAGDERRDVDFEADELRRVVRVGFDVRSAAFRITAPGEVADGCRLRSGRQRRDEQGQTGRAGRVDKTESRELKCSTRSGIRGRGSGARVQPQHFSTAALRYSLAKTR
jgi:hypothetical protein